MYRISALLICFVLVLSLAGSASGSLVAHWRLDETSGNIAYDSSGNGHDGTLQGDAQWTSGRIGGALDFDGSDDYVDIAYSPALSLNEFTFSAWVNIAVEPGVFGVFGTRVGGDTTFDFKVEATMVHGDIGNGSAINVIS